MARNFICGDRRQLFLLPPSVDQWVPKNHVVRFIWDIVHQMDLTPFYNVYSKEGGPPYDPGMMLSVLIYAYCQGRRSSRKIAKACMEELPYRWLTANTNPDHCAIARFRARHEKHMKQVFTEVLSLCAETGLVRVGNVFLDGTKVKANASLSANKTLDQLRKEVDEMIKEAKAQDEAEDKEPTSDELPKELEDPTSRLARLKEAKARLEAKAKEEREEQEEKIRARQEEEKATGRKKGGRKPKSPDEAVDKDRKANVTDPDSRIMKTRQGYVQGYNSQAVATQDQIILAAQVTQEENDLYQLEPMIKAANQSIAEAGIENKINTCTADTGYWRDDLPVEQIEKDGPELLIAIQKDCKQRNDKEDCPCGRIPQDITSRERMARKLKTKRGKAIYRLRGQTIEPVFGQIKEGLGLRGFLRRGLEAVQSEWELICACHNLMKVFRAFGVVVAG